MKIINTLEKINTIYQNGTFDLKKWENYINSFNPYLYSLCYNDLNDCLTLGMFTFEKDVLPILNNVINEKQALNATISSFNKVTSDLNDKILRAFKKPLSVEIILYLGLCNGAGWVVTNNGNTLCLLGVEKIIELGWTDEKSLTGLIYHELGHVYQNQYGILERNFNSDKERFFWQLFTEGIATYFEQALVNDFNYFHQDKDGWQSWCEENLLKIKEDFYNDLSTMTQANQRYFGDWVYYNGKSDVGYFLGAKFVQYICKTYSFNDILSLNIEKVESLYKQFLKN